MKELSKNTGIKMTDIINLSLIDFLLKTKDRYEYQGIDFTEYLRVLKEEKLRTYVNKVRNEFLSMNLFIPRVNRDIWKLLLYNKSKSEDERKELISKYINIRIKEARHFKDSHKLIEELEEMKDKLEQHTAELQSFMKSKIADTKYFEQISKDEVI